jgi:phosphatidylcholine synthase
VIALYLFVLGLEPWVNAVILILFAVLVFVPIRYLYPSRMQRGQRITYALGIVWAVMVFWMLVQFPSPSRPLVLATLFFPAYYVTMSIWVHLRTPPSPRHTPRPAD